MAEQQQQRINIGKVMVFKYRYSFAIQAWCLRNAYLTKGANKYKAWTCLHCVDHTPPHVTMGSPINIISIVHG